MRYRLTADAGQKAAAAVRAAEEERQREEEEKMRLEEESVRREERARTEAEEEAFHACKRNAQTLERQVRAADGIEGLLLKAEVKRLKAELDTVKSDVQSYKVGLAAATEELNQAKIHLQVEILHAASASNKVSAQ